jgi:hypothetical protein
MREDEIADGGMVNKHQHIRYVEAFGYLFLPVQRTGIFASNS